MRTTLAMLLMLSIAVGPLYAEETIDSSVARRYHDVITKMQAHTVRSADIESLITALDLRNRDAARRNIDRDTDALLRARKTEIATHIITPAEATMIAAMNPGTSVEEILASNHKDRGKIIDEFLARGGTRGLWREELIMLRQQSLRIAQLEQHPLFRPAAYNVENAPILYENYDGFYDVYVYNANGPLCEIAGDFESAGWIVCWLTGAHIENPACWIAAVAGAMRIVCHYM